MSGVRVRRGRAAAYRHVWQWPLRGPARALGCAVVALVLAAGVGSLGTSRTPSPPAAGSSAATAGAHPLPPPAPGSPAPQPATPPPAVAPTPTTAASASPIQPAGVDTAAPTVIAEGWAKAWLAGGPGTTWLAGLAPYTTEEYLGLLATTNTANLPGGGLTHPVTVITNTATNATIDVPTTHLRLRLTLIRTPTGWRVTNSDHAPT